jgi:tetratricopeptide (TPR) repeat protein
MSGNMESGDSFYDEINLACERLEAEWQAGAEPRIEEYLVAVPEAAQPDLARELLKLDIYYRRERGDTIGPEDYMPRFREHITLIETLLAAHSSTVYSTRLTRAGRYKLEHPIGSGGMGEVHRAHDADFSRPLAVKILKEEFKDRPDFVARFLEEARITGQLQHPGVPPVHEIGRLEDGRPFLAMKLIEGRTLAELLAERKNPSDGLPRFLTIFQQICQTVAYAHSRLVIHRDLKPANVMVGAFGEVQVMDWGLAKALAAEVPKSAPQDIADKITPSPFEQETAVVRTQYGKPMGTWAYMPPEQALGNIDKVDERSDVFSLGATLCEIVTGESAYRGNKVRVQAESADLADAFSRLDSSGADAELVALAKKCLHAEMDLRPRDAGAVSAAFAAYRAEVQERLRKAELERAAAEARAQEERRTAVAERRARRRTLWFAAASVLLVVAAGSGAWWYQHERAARETARLVRQADTVRDVSAALARVDNFLQQGWKQTDYPERWQVTVGLAESAIETAEGLLAAGEPTEELTEQVRAMRAAVDEASRDRKLRAELDRIRLDLAETKNVGFGGYDSARITDQYRTALRTYGIDEAKPSLSVQLLRSCRLREAVLAGVQDWARITPDPMEERQLQELLSKAEPESDPFRARWRSAWQQRDSMALSELAQETKVENLAEADLLNFAQDLFALGQREAALGLLRTRQERHPNSYWLNFKLGDHLLAMGSPHEEEAMRFLTAAMALRSNSQVYEEMGRALYSKHDLEGAIRHYRTAVELNPKVATAHYNLGAVLSAKGDLDGAIHCYRTAYDLEPMFALAQNSLGVALTTKGDLEGAIRCFRTAIELRPKLVEAYPKATVYPFEDVHTNLGIALFQQNHVEEAIGSYRTAIKLNFKYAPAHLNLGIALQAKGDLEGAVNCFRAVTELNSKDVGAHFRLGRLLADKGDLEGAIRSFRSAVDLDPKNAHSQSNLGVALHFAQDLEGAIRCLSAAVKLDDKLFEAHTNLGAALFDRRDVEGAIRCYQKAIKISPKFAPAHGAMGKALLGQGRFAEARAALQKSLELSEPGQPLHALCSQLLRSCEAFLALDAKLSATLKGQNNSIDSSEQIAIARLCQENKRFYAAAARLYGDAFAAQPKLADDLGQGHRYNAACAAVLAGSGQGEDAANLGGQERARLRKQALEWIRADLSAWSKLADDAKQRARIRRTLQHWQKYADFAGVRGDALLELSETEGQEWLKLWRDVASLLK